MKPLCRMYPTNHMYFDQGFSTAKAKKGGHELGGEKRSGPAYFHLSLRDAAKELGNTGQIDMSRDQMMILVGGRGSIAELFTAGDAPTIKLMMPAYLDCERVKFSDDHKRRRVVRLIACGKTNLGGIDLSQGGGEGRRYYPLTDRFGIPQDQPLQTLTATAVGLVLAGFMDAVQW